MARAPAGFGAVLLGTPTAPLSIPTQRLWCCRRRAPERVRCADAGIPSPCAACTQVVCVARACPGRMPHRAECQSSGCAQAPCLQVFDALWASLAAGDAAAGAAAVGAAGAATGAGPRGEAPGAPWARAGRLSLRPLDLPPAAAEAALAAALGPFAAGAGLEPPAEPPALVAGLVGAGALTRVSRVLAFLPPAHHLLLRLECGEAGGASGGAPGAVRVRVGTDFAPCLAWVDELLDEVFGAAGPC